MKYQFKNQDDAWITAALDDTKRRKMMDARLKLRKLFSVCVLVGVITLSFCTFVMLYSKNSSYSPFTITFLMLLLSIQSSYQNEAEIKLLKTIEALQKSQQNSSEASS